MEEIQSVLTIYKQKGETPLECINRFKQENPLYSDSKMTYAGRLDPMAEGLLLVLVGEECKKKETYLALHKEYEVDVLFGVSTDTGDCLGVVKKVVEKNIVFDKNLLERHIGKKNQKYPMYSSRTVDGIPLFAWARKGIEKIFKKEVEVFSIDYIKQSSIKAESLLLKVREDVDMVVGDFRQDEIIDSWEKHLVSLKNSFVVITIKVTCSSGTYMRVLAEEIGVDVGIPALALRIKRTKVGNFSGPLL
jgi:tRNA pseudouridine55 synthase